MVTILGYTVSLDVVALLCCADSCRICPPACQRNRAPCIRTISPRQVLHSLRRSSLNVLSSYSLSARQNHYHVNLEDEVVRRSIITHNGEVLWPAPAPQVLRPRLRRTPHLSNPYSFLGGSRFADAAYLGFAKPETTTAEVTPGRSK